MFSLPRLILPIFFCGLAFTPLGAVSVTPESVAVKVHQANPDLAAARLRIREAAGRQRQSGRWSNPELEVAFEHDPRFRAGEIEVGFAQRFPITNRLKLERQVSRTLLKAAEAEVAEAERRLTAQAQRLVVELLILRQRGELLAEQAKIAAVMAERLEEASQRGEVSALDAGQARLEAAAVGIGQQSLELREITLLGELKTLLGIAPHDPLHLSGLLPAPALPTSRPGADTPAQRPDYRAAQLQTEAARERVALERARRYEDLQAGLYSRLERTPEQDNDAFIGLRLSLPLPLWNRNEGAIEEATARHERHALEAEALGQHIRHEAATAYAGMEQSLRSIRKLDAELIPLARDRERRLQEAWEAGQSDLQALFAIRSRHQQLILARLDALRDFHLARVRYQAALGQPRATPARK